MPDTDEEPPGVTQLPPVGQGGPTQLVAVPKGNPFPSDSGTLGTGTLLQDIVSTTGKSSLPKGIELKPFFKGPVYAAGKNFSPEFERFLREIFEDAVYFGRDETGGLLALHDVFTVTFGSPRDGLKRLFVQYPEKASGLPSHWTTIL